MQNNQKEDNIAQDEIYRFIQDLEFVQCLSNPNYLKFLSSSGYFDDEEFINYLKYLLYFKKPEYMKYLTYGNCLLFLDLLQYKEFREQLKINNYIQFQTENGIQSMSYSQCLDDFIKKNWKSTYDRFMNESENINNINNINTDNNTMNNN